MRAKIMEKDATPASAMKRLNKVGEQGQIASVVGRFSSHPCVTAPQLLRQHGADSKGLTLMQFKACMKEVLLGDGKGGSGASGARIDQTLTEVQ